MRTLIAWGRTEKPPALYVVTEDTGEYQCCDGRNIDDHEIPETVELRIEHLGYLLGEEPYYVGKNVPTLESFLKANELDKNTDPDERKGVRASEDRAKPEWWFQNAPWAKFRITDPADLIDVERIISTSWL